MKRGDLAKIKKNRLNSPKFDRIFLFSDRQIKKIQNYIYLENYTFRFKDDECQFIHVNEIVLILDHKDLYKDSNGADILWDRFLKVISSSGLSGWVYRSHLEKINV
jgi:hypothetical protein